VPLSDDVSSSLRGHPRHRAPWVAGGFDGEIRNAVGLAFHASPGDGLVIVAARDRYFIAPMHDDNVAIGDAAVASYPYLGNISSNHGRLPWLATSLCHRRR
jgi:hypothetical protein